MTTENDAQGSPTEPVGLDRYLRTCWAEYQDNPSEANLKAFNHAIDMLEERDNYVHQLQSENTDWRG